MTCISIPAKAFDYNITFTGSGASTTVDSVVVQNLSKSTQVTVHGGTQLRLTDVISGINELHSIADLAFVYPNPITGNATYTFTAKYAGKTQIAIFGLDGRKVAGLDADLQQGNNSFLLALPTGVFLVQAIGNGFSYTTKTISLSMNTSKPKISYSGNTTYSKPKRAPASEIKFLYSTGDQLLYKGYSGNFCTIVTDRPTNNKTTDFEFVECTDADGNLYAVVHIGNQTWMAENLRTTKYRNGDVIPNVTVNSSWAGLNTGAWCYYNNEVTYGTKYGKLFNYYAVTDSRNIAPPGWHIPADAEWTELENELIANGYNYDGTTTNEKIAKSLAATTDWLSDTSTGVIGNDLSKNNSSGFTALPGGGRYNLSPSSNMGVFGSIGAFGYWWSSTEIDATDASGWALFFRNYNLRRIGDTKSYGNSVRCLKGEVPALTTTAATNITSNGVILGGNVTSDGGSSIIARGICWNTTGNPTINNFKTSDGAGIGSFNSEIIGLSPSTTYYVRAYSTNSIGTGYGTQISFTTLAPEPISVSFSFADEAASCSDVSGLLTIQQMTQIYNATGLPMSQFYQIYSLTNSGDGTLTQTGNDYQLNWKLTSNQIWNKLMIVSPATFTTTAVFTPSDMTHYSIVTVTITRKFTKPTSINIPSSQLMSMFWYSNAAVSPYPYVKHTIRRPEINENTSTLAVFENNLNQVFMQNLNKSLMGFSNYEYYFLPSQPIHVDGTANGTTLTVSADGKQLLSGSVVVATINPFVANTGDILTLNRNSYVAKRLLNYNKESLKVRIGIRTAYCENLPQFKMPVTINGNPYFDVVFVRPINVEPTNGQYFVDGKDYGQPNTYIEVRKMVNLADWRNSTDYVSTFNQYPYFYGYYGVTNITVNTSSIKTDLNGSLRPVTDFPDLLVAYEPTVIGVTPSAQYGYLTYRNNGALIGVDFNLFIPATITYSWGEIVSEVIKVPVKRIVTPVGIKALFKRR